MDPYATLGVRRDATPAQVKAAFRRASKRTHPDAGGSAEAFAALKRAHVVLADPEKRSHYDRTGQMPEDVATNPDNQAFQVIAAMLGGLLDQGEAEELCRNDLVSVMVKHIEHVLGEQRKQIAKLERMVKRADRIKGRFTKAAGEGPNMLEGILAGRVIECRRSIEALTAAIGHGARAVEILKEYRFRADAVQNLAEIQQAMQQRAMQMQQNAFQQSLRLWTSSSTT